MAQSLELEGARGRFSGRVILVATGNVRIGAGAGKAGPDDLVRVISYGTVSVGGECQCSVVANKNVLVGQWATIRGNLIVRDVRDFGSLRGTIIKDPRLYSGRTVPGDTSGAYTDYYYVAVGPGETYRLIGRR